MENSKRHNIVYAVGCLTVGYYVGCFIRDFGRESAKEINAYTAKKKKERTEK